MTELITETWAHRDPTLTEVSHSEEDKIRELFVGRRVEKVADDHLRLDDGTLLRVVPNEGGCACSAGDYELTALNGVDNVITSVELVDEKLNPDDKYGEAYAYRVFVFADNERINLLSVEGDDGNGYYGTGYSILVRRP